MLYANTKKTLLHTDGTNGARTIDKMYAEKNRLKPTLGCFECTA